ncbi:hypothetical protein DH2020_023738 [Rehmannia glutinosa]|uniref:Dirigent protein n=1 Tax=Rehmannia glutinosa TaxID=99300 RepID=A0ABR0W8B4_REHGL
MSNNSKAHVILLLGPLLFISMFVAHAEAQFPNAAHELAYRKERLTKLRFYVQDLVGGENPTVWKVAQSNLTDVLPSAFGLLSVLDNLVTSGPEIDSKEVGRIQGVIGLSDFHEKALVMLLNLVFTEGEYKGSTLSILGRNPLDDEIREVPIVGGTGVFRMARGYAITTTYAVDEAHTHAGEPAEGEAEHTTTSMDEMYGPIDTSILTLQHKHRSKDVYIGDVDSVHSISRAGGMFLEF